MKSNLIERKNKIICPLSFPFEGNHQSKSEDEQYHHQKWDRTRQKYQDRQQKIDLAQVPLLKNLRSQQISQRTLALTNSFCFLIFLTIDF